jgi:hypothetical protein
MHYISTLDKSVAHSLWRIAYLVFLSYSGAAAFRLFIGLCTVSPVISVLFVFLFILSCYIVGLSLFILKMTNIECSQLETIPKEYWRYLISCRADAVRAVG